MTSALSIAPSSFASDIQDFEGQSRTKEGSTIVYSATFIFKKIKFDEEFHKLDEAIAKAACEIDGYLGEESWENPTTGAIVNVYYWESLEALHGLINHPTHIHAKSLHQNWLTDYQVIISKVIKAYGSVDSRFHQLSHAE